MLIHYFILLLAKARKIRFADEKNEEEDEEQDKNEEKVYFLTFLSSSFKYLYLKI